jgi:hypothetical protein
MQSPVGVCVVATLNNLSTNIKAPLREFMVGFVYGWSTCRDKFVTSTLQSESEFVNYWSELFDFEWTETGSHVCGDVLSIWTLCLIGVELCIGLRTPLGDSGGNSLMSSMQIGLQLLASSLSTRGTK